VQVRHTFTKEIDIFTSISVFHLEFSDFQLIIDHLSNPTNCLCMYMHVSFNYCFCMRETDRDRDRERALLYHEKTIIVVMQSH
jgi:hypothetical protein